MCQSNVLQSPKHVEVGLDNVGCVPQLIEVGRVAGSSPVGCNCFQLMFLLCSLNETGRGADQ